MPSSTSADAIGWFCTRDGLVKLLQEIPLSDEERTAVDGDVAALSRLIEWLSDVPTPGECQRVKSIPHNQRPASHGRL